MKQHILHLLYYNNTSNLRVLDSILQLPDREEALMLFSHLITAQDKWYNRVNPKEDDSLHSWFGKVYEANVILKEWEKSIDNWISLVSSMEEQQLEQDIYFIRQMDGKGMKVKLQDILLQINYHSMHHRAQINKMISAQGFTPPATDYILGAISEAG